MNGIAHIQLSVANFEECVPFYRGLTGFFEMMQLIDTDGMFYAIGSRTDLAISKCDPDYEGQRFA
jgi:catechol 2,3-dioxygenase-like lactoylglutathione lyase family enzyme